MKLNTGMLVGITPLLFNFTIATEVVEPTPAEKKESVIKSLSAEAEKLKDSIANLISQTSATGTEIDKSQIQDYKNKAFDKIAEFAIQYKQTFNSYFDIINKSGDDAKKAIIEKLSRPDGLINFQKYLTDTVTDSEKKFNSLFNEIVSSLQTDPSTVNPLRDFLLNNEVFKECSDIFSQIAKAKDPSLLEKFKTEYLDKFFIDVNNFKNAMKGISSDASGESVFYYAFIAFFFILSIFLIIMLYKQTYPEDSKETEKEQKEPKEDS